jgi:hypothetical protein
MSPISRLKKELSFKHQQTLPIKPKPESDSNNGRCQTAGADRRPYPQSENEPDPSANILRPFSAPVWTTWISDGESSDSDNGWVTRTTSTPSSKDRSNISNTMEMKTISTLSRRREASLHHSCHFR